MRARLVARRLDWKGRVIWQGGSVELESRTDFVAWIRACCHAAGFAERARRQTDLPQIWIAMLEGTQSEFSVRNYSPIGAIAELNFSRVA